MLFCRPRCRLLQTSDTENQAKLHFLMNLSVLYCFMVTCFCILLVYLLPTILVSPPTHSHCELGKSIAIQFLQLGQERPASFATPILFQCTAVSVLRPNHSALHFVGAGLWTEPRPVIFNNWLNKPPCRLLVVCNRNNKLLVTETPARLQVRLAGSTELSRSSRTQPLG